jgi:hypothetical protein
VFLEAVEVPVDLDAEGGSSSRRDSIVNDLTHKKILVWPDASAATAD